MVDYTRNSSNDITLTSTYSTLFTDTESIATDMTLYTNSGIASGKIIDTITGNTFTTTDQPLIYRCWRWNGINYQQYGWKYVFTTSEIPAVNDLVYIPYQGNILEKYVLSLSDRVIQYKDTIAATTTSHCTSARYSAGDTSDLSTVTDNYYIECLTGDTLVTMADKSAKRLDEIEIGDKVLSINPDTGELVEDEVIFSDKNENKSYTEYNLWKFTNDYEVKTVHRHRFYNVEDNCFVYMDRWNIGDHAINEKGEMLELLSHEVVREKVKHYKITTKTHHNYFANGMLTGSRLTKSFDYKKLKLGEE